MAIKLGLSINDITPDAAAFFFVAPPVTFWVTKRICLSLQRRDRDLVLHGRETGRIIRPPRAASRSTSRSTPTLAGTRARAAPAAAARGRCRPERRGLPHRPQGPSPGQGVALLLQGPGRAGHARRARGGPPRRHHAEAIEHQPRGGAASSRWAPARTRTARTASVTDASHPRYAAWSPDHAAYLCLAPTHGAPGVRRPDGRRASRERPRGRAAEPLRGVLRCRVDLDDLGAAAHARDEPGGALRAPRASLHGPSNGSGWWRRRRHAARTSDDEDGVAPPPGWPYDPPTRVREVPGRTSR